MSSIETGRSPVSILHICFVSAEDVCPVSTKDICPISTEDIKAWLAEAATAADKTNGRESLACGGRVSGRQKKIVVPWMTQV